MSGEGARDRNSGKGDNPKLTPKAADRLLYDIHINIPIDTQTHSNGHDSGDEDTSEKAWRLRGRDNLMPDTADVTPFEMHFVDLWTITKSSAENVNIFSDERL